MSEPLWLGVDAGGTNVSAVLLGPSGWQSPTVRLDGGANVNTLGVARTFQRLDEVGQAACREADVPAERIANALFAVAGCGSDNLRQQLAARCRSAWGGRSSVVTSDFVPLLAATALDCPAVVLIAGTGSIAVGRPPLADVSELLKYVHDQPLVRAGGWGPAVGDEGSGLWLARQGLLAVARAVDGRGPSTSLSEGYAQAVGACEPDSVVHRAASLDTPQLAGLARQLLLAATEGDLVAREIRDAAAGALASHVRSVLRRLPTPSNRYWLVLAGGVLQHDQALRQDMMERLDIRGTDRSRVLVASDPALWAARLAGRLSAN